MNHDEVDVEASKSASKHVYSGSKQGYKHACTYISLVGHREYYYTCEWTDSAKCDGKRPRKEL